MRGRKKISISNLIALLTTCFLAAKSDLIHSFLIVKLQYIYNLTISDLGTLNNREYATATFLLSLLLIALINSDTLEKQLITLVKLMLKRHQIIITLLIFAYLLACISILKSLNLWSISQTKTTAIWVVISYASIIFGSLEAMKNDSFFKERTNEIIKASFIVEFICNTQTFNFIAELILVSLITIIIITIEISKPLEELPQDKKTAINFLQSLLSITGLLLLTSSTYYLISNTETLITHNNFREVITPILLSIMFIFFIYSFSIFLFYEKVFKTRLIFIRDKKIKNYAKEASIIYFFPNTGLVDKWISSLSVLDVSTRSQIDDSIKKIKLERKLDRRPAIVNLEDGWSPHKSKRYLNLYGLSPKTYKNIYGEYCVSDSINFTTDETIEINTVTYQISGNEHHAQELQLSFFIHNITNKEGIETFVQMCKTMTEASLSVGLCSNIQKAILSIQKVETEIKGKAIEIDVDQNMYSSGCSITFTISNTKDRKCTHTVHKTCKNKVY